MKLRRIAVCTAISAILLSTLNGCSKNDPFEGAIVGENSFIITLYPDIAPITCENFQELVENGFYNGLTFHRVVDKFVAQGGDPNGDGTGASDKAITGEFSANGVANNLSHVRGTVSMARAEDYNSATCQFFICYEDLTYLDGSYAAFGNVTEGMEVVDGFLRVPRDTGRMGEISSPVTPIYIQYAGIIDPDSAGNPRVQFLIYTDENSKGTTNVNETTVPAITSSAAPAETSSDIITDISDQTFETETSTVSTVG
ncbi:MAG: peptidylprolyl isomerase [Ruminococcus sp.]